MQLLTIWHFSPWLRLAIVIFCAVLLAAFVPRYLLPFWNKRLNRHKFWPSELDLQTYLGYPFVLLVFFCAMWIKWPLVGLAGETAYILHALLRIIFLLLLTLNITRLIGLGKLMLFKAINIQVVDNLRQRQVYTQLQFIEKLIYIFVWILAISLILMSFEEARKYGASLLASAGVASLVIGASAQKTLGSLIAGFQIAFTQPIRIDDVVVIEKEFGRIEEITLTYVVVRLWDKRILVLPITYFVENHFENWTRSTTDIIGSVFLYVDYSLPVDKIRDNFMAILQESQLWDGKTASVQITNCKDFNMELRCLMSATDAAKAWDLRALVREKLITYIQQNYPESLPRLRFGSTPHN